MKKTMDLRFAWLVSLIGLVLPVFGQTSEEPTGSKDRDIYSSIASYPTDLRSSVLTVAQYPQVLVKLQRIQSRSSQSFQDLISGYPREEQEKFYDLSRYPDRLRQLIRDGKKSSEEARRIVADLPKESQSSILYVYENHFNDLAKIDYIYQSSDDALHKLIEEYPNSTQDDFRKVISRPEVMDLLTDNIDLTTSLGEDYKENPGAVVAQLDSLGALQQQNLADYKKEVENDPEMQKELENAADRFSSSYAQSDRPVDSYLGTQTAPQAPIVNNYYYNYNPYPYWSSYPYWYASPIWYPVPYYYHTGFYYGPGGHLVVFGFPSFSYSSWFFGFGYRYYPHLYTRYHVYYRPAYTYGGRYGNHYNNRYSGHYDGRQYNGRRYDGRSGGGGSTNSGQSPRYSRGRTNPADQNGRTNRQTSYLRPFNSTNGRSSVLSNNSGSRSATQQWVRPQSTTPSRTFTPTHRTVITPSNTNRTFTTPSQSGGSRSPMMHSGSSGRSSAVHSSGGGGSRSSGGSGGSRGGGGGGGGRRGR